MDMVMDADMDTLIYYNLLTSKPYPFCSVVYSTSCFFYVLYILYITVYLTIVILYVSYIITYTKMVSANLADFPKCNTLTVNVTPQLIFDKEIFALCKTCEKDNFVEFYFILY